MEMADWLVSWLRRADVRFSSALCIATGAVSQLERPGGLVAWLTTPTVLQGGQRARLLYNAQAGPLGFMCPLPSPPTVILGHNGWLDTQVPAALFAGGFTAGRATPYTLLACCHAHRCVCCR